MRSRVVGRAVIFAVAGIALTHLARADEKAPTLVRTIEARMAVNSIAFSPDGKTLAVSSTSSGTISIFETASGDRVGELKTYSREGNDKLGSSGVLGVAFSASGALAAIHGVMSKKSPQVFIWHVSSQTVTHELHRGDYQNPVSANSIAFSPDASTLAVTDESRSIILFDATSGAEVKRFTSNTTPRCAAFAPDGKTFATSDDAVIHLWELAGRGKWLRTFKGHEGNVTSLSFSRDGTKLASGSMDWTVVLWDVAAGKQISKRNVYSDASSGAVVFSPAGTLIASAGKQDRFGSFRLWDGATLDLRHEVRPPKETSRGCLAFSPDGALLAQGGSDGRVLLWDVATATPK